MATQDFTEVTYKRNHKKQLKITDQFSTLSLSDDDFDIEEAVRKIIEAKDEIIASDYSTGVQRALRKALSSLANSMSEDSRQFNSVIPKELICFDMLSIKVIKISDPALSENDIKLVEYFKIGVIEDNIEAKYKVLSYTLFYLPHCPKQLTNNLLWANWSNASLEKCLILSNSFFSLLGSHTKNHLIENAGYVLKISSYVKELIIFNTFKYFEVFNESGLHVFPKLQLIDEDFWLHADEPKYVKDVEYIEA